MRSRGCRRTDSRDAGFSMIEMIVVVAIIGVLAGLGAVSYSKFINRQRLETAADIIAASLRQARQLAIATREPHRVVFSVPDVTDLSNPLPQEVWIEVLKKSRDPRGGSVENWVEVTEGKRLPDGVQIISFNDTKPGDRGNSRLYYAEFNFQGQMAKHRFSSDPLKTPSLALYIHLARVGQEPDPGVAEDRLLVSSVEVLRLTGRVRTYDYAYGTPFPTTEYRG